MTRGLGTHRTKARRFREHTNISARHLIRARLRASDTIHMHVSFNGLLITRRIYRDSYSYTRLYKGELVSPSRYDLLFPHSSSDHEHWSVNVSADTFRPTAKIHRHRTGALFTTVAYIGLLTDKSKSNTD